MSLSHIRGETLDLGAGTAKYKPIICERAETYVAFDRFPGPNIDVVGDVHNLPFDDCSFDTIVCTGVMEHVKEPWVMVEEIQRVLRPGGKCIMIVPFIAAYHADPEDYYRFSIAGASHLFLRTGMKIVDSAKYGGINVVLAEALKFSICNPYVHTAPGFFRRNIFRAIYRFLLACSHGTQQDGIIFANTYLVTQKST